MKDRPALYHGVTLRGRPPGVHREKIEGSPPDPIYVRSQGGLDKSRIVRHGVVAVLAALALAVLVGTPVYAQTSYTIIDLGLLPGTSRSYPEAINSTNPANVMVVGTTVHRGALRHAFYWSMTTGIVDIGVLGSGSFSKAVAVNSSGEVVGHSATTSTGTYPHAIYWHPSRGPNNPLDLGTRVVGGYSVANSINDAGIIVGESDSRAVYWQPTSPGPYGTPIELQSLTTGGYCGAFRINAAGDIVGTCTTPAGNPHPVLWENTSTSETPTYGAPIDLGLPDGGTRAFDPLINAFGQVTGPYNTSSGIRTFFWSPGDIEPMDIGTLGSDYSTQPWGLNDSGKVAGTSFLVSGLKSSAFVWSKAESIENLGTLGGDSSRGESIYGSSGPRGCHLNNLGQVVGWSETTTKGGTHGFIWDRVNRMRDLNKLTPNRGRFEIRDGTCITDNGYITGIGRIGSETHAYLLIPNP